ADDAPGFHDVLSALACLDAPCGVYAVPGNHDHAVGIDTWHRDVGAHPVVRDLTNRAVVLDRGGARLCVAGADDLSMGQPDLGGPPPADGRDSPRLLPHAPGQANRARRAYDAVDLIVSGHTHGGQVRFPFVGALHNPSRYDELYEEGLRRRPWTQVYTSR